MALCLQELYQPLFHLKPIFCKADQSDLHLVSSILCRSAYIIGSFFSSFNVWISPFCPAISRFFLVIRPPIRPLSLVVRHLHPPATTLSARPSSAAISASDCWDPPAPVSFFPWLLVHLFSFFLEKYSQKREPYTESFRTRMPPGRPGTYPFQNAAQAMEKALPRKRSLRPLKKTGTGRHGSAPVPIYVPAVF